MKSPGTWVPATDVEDHGSVFLFLVAVVIWGVNPQMEDILSLCFSHPFFCLPLPLKQINKTFFKNRTFRNSGTICMSVAMHCIVSLHDVDADTSAPEHLGLE